MELIITASSLPSSVHAAASFFVSLSRYRALKSGGGKQYKGKRDSLDQLQLQLLIAGRTEAIYIGCIALVYFLHNEREGNDKVAQNRANSVLVDKLLQFQMLKFTLLDVSQPTFKILFNVSASILPKVSSFKLPLNISPRVCFVKSLGQKKRERRQSEGTQMCSCHPRQNKLMKEMEEG